MVTQRDPAGPDLSALKIDERARRRRGTGRPGRLAVAALVLLLLAGGSLWALRDRAPVVEVVVARGGDDGKPAALLNASGYVTPRRRSTVAAKVTGRVEQVFAEEGMQVREGQVLATLDCSEASSRLVSARADRDATSAAIADLEVNLANAERELDRARRLEAAGLTSRQSLDLASTTADSFRARIALTREQVRAAEARIVVAQRDVDNCTVRAPFDGLVVSKDAQPGEIVSPLSAGGGFTRTGIATLVDMKSLEVEVDVNESYIARVSPGQPVTAVLDAYPSWSIPARVRTVIPTADRQKATVKVRVAFDRLDPRILPDMGVKVAFLDRARPAGAGAVQCLIPREAVRDDAGASVVFLYRDGRAERRAVGLGEARGADVEVLAGVAAGERVIRSPGGLRDGQRVTASP